MRDLDSDPLVCGGLAEGALSPTCHEYKPRLDRWTETSGEMLEARAYFGYTAHPELGLVMGGGRVSKARI